MYDLLIKNGKLVNGGLVDVAILNEKIARVGLIHTRIVTHRRQFITMNPI